MGFFNGKKREARIKARAETRIFRQIVRKKTTQAARQAFSEEAIKVAVEKAKVRARKPSIGELLSKQVRGAVKRKAFRTITKRRTQVRKTIPRGPTSLNEAMFGVK